MIKFVNAKINLGLNVVRKRPDGYHDLSTVFYPIGVYAGSPMDYGLLADVLEIVHGEQDELYITGNAVDCDIKNNLVWKALMAYRAHRPNLPKVKIFLEKHLPSQAGMGGGSADASFTLLALNDLCPEPLNETELLSLAATIGADCPYFIINKPCAAYGIGEILKPISLDLSGKWAVVLKPDVNISTAEAFRYVKPCESEYVPEEIVKRPLEEWRYLLKNDFETSIFTLFPELAEIKTYLYGRGALYSSMSGSGSAFYGIFDSQHLAEQAVNDSNLPFKTIALL